jgi:hypothetical protein
VVWDGPGTSIETGEPAIILNLTIGSGESYANGLPASSATELADKIHECVDAS